jgi:low temperature requirement protein LtrA
MRRVPENQKNAPSLSCVRRVCTQRAPDSSLRPDLREQAISFCRFLRGVFPEGPRQELTEKRPGLGGRSHSKALPRKFMQPGWPTLAYSVIVKKNQMNTKPVVSQALHHHLRRMTGRDAHEQHRAATSLEALFDLTFATCFGLVATQFCHALTEGHYMAALVGFSFGSFAICWAWTNFSWFSSAYDTDDWSFRLVTMIQMIGVLVLAIGLPRMFASINHAKHIDNSIMVLGYVIMRIAMVFQWLRAARQDRPRRRTCLTYALAISIAQVGWVVQIFMDTSVSVAIVLTCALALIEFASPLIAELTTGGTPWHAHHIVERYSLFALIALGEGVVGTIAVLSAVIQTRGWSTDVALICIAGIGLTFGMWWLYYLLPSAQVLHAHRNRAFVWGCGQMVAVVSIVATGAGLQVAAHFIDRASQIGSLPTLLCVAIPLSAFLGSIYALYYFLVRRDDPLHRWLLLATSAIIAAAVIASLAGTSMAVCLVILMVGPAMTVAGYEICGYRSQSQALTDSHSDQKSVEKM